MFNAVAAGTGGAVPTAGVTGNLGYLPPLYAQNQSNQYGGVTDFSGIY